MRRDHLFFCDCSAGVGGFHCVRPMVMIVVTAGSRKAFPLAPFPVLVTLEYCSLSMTQQMSRARMQGSRAGFSAQCCVFQEPRVITHTTTGLWFLKGHKIETALQRVSASYCKWLTRHVLAGAFACKYDFLLSLVHWNSLSLRASCAFGLQQWLGTS